MCKRNQAQHGHLDLKDRILKPTKVGICKSTSFHNQLLVSNNIGKMSKNESTKILTSQESNLERKLMQERAKAFIEDYCAFPNERLAFVHSSVQIDAKISGPAWTSK